MSTVAENVQALRARRKAKRVLVTLEMDKDLHRELIEIAIDGGLLDERKIGDRRAVIAALSSLVETRLTENLE